MSLLGQSVNVAASLAFANLFKKKTVPEKKKIQLRPKLTYDLKEAATIGDLKCDVIIDREVTFSSEVTQNPVEDGFSVSDHISRKPISLTMTVLFTPTPVTWFDEKAKYRNRLAEVLNALQDIYKKAEPITIKTVDAIYKNMVMLDAPLPRKVEDGYCYSAQISFVQIRRVVQKTEALPNSSATGKNGATESEGGQAAQDDIGTGITTIDNEATTQINAAIISKGQGGDVQVGKEQKSKAVVKALTNCLKRAVISTLVNKVGSKLVGKSSPLGKLSKLGGGIL